MIKRNLEALSERERACLAHLQEAERLGASFSRYCRDKELSMDQWRWVKRALVRKGVIEARRWSRRNKSVGFAPVRVVPAVTPTACRLRHPSGWMIECAGLPTAAWLTALVSGEPR